MAAWVWVLIAIAIVAVLAVVLWQALARRRTGRLQDRFGPERLDGNHLQVDRMHPRNRALLAQVLGPDAENDGAIAISAKRAVVRGGERQAQGGSAGHDQTARRAIRLRMPGLGSTVQILCTSGG